MKGVCLNKVPVLSPVFVSKLFCQIICFVFFSMFSFQSPPGLIINISLAANKGKRRFSTERYRLYSKSNTVVTGEQCMREFVTKWNNFFPLRNSRKFTPKFSDFFSKWKATQKFHSFRKFSSGTNRKIMFHLPPNRKWTTPSRRRGPWERGCY